MILVAGATGPGGRAVVGELTARGHRVIAIGRDHHKLQQLALEVTDGGVLGRVIDPADRVALGELASQERVDSVVNLVGGWEANATGTLTLPTYERLERALLRAPMMLADAFAAQIKARGGVFVQVTTPTSVTGDHHNLAHAAMKAGADNVVTSLSRLFSDSTARAVSVEVISLVNDDLRAAQPKRAYKGATETTELAAVVAAIIEGRSGQNGQRL